MITLFDISKQLKKTISIFQVNPMYYKKGGISRISAHQSKVEQFSLILARNSIEKILQQAAVHEDDFPDLLIGVLKLSFSTPKIFTDSHSKITDLELMLADDQIEDKQKYFLTFYNALKTSDSVDDILLVQIIHDFIHIAYNIVQQKNANQMTAENCGMIFGANIANLLKIDPEIGLKLNRVVTTLIEGSVFSIPFVFDQRMRSCLQARQQKLSMMVADMALQADKATQSVSLSNDSVVPADFSDEYSNKVKYKESRVLKRKLSKSETEVVSTLDQIASLRCVMTLYEIELAQLISVLAGGLDENKPVNGVVSSPREFSQSPRAGASPRRFILAGSSSSIGGASSSSSGSINSVSAPIDLPPPVFGASYVGCSPNASSSCSPISSPPGAGFFLLRQVVSPRGALSSVSSSTHLIGGFESDSDSDPEVKSKVQKHKK